MTHWKPFVLALLCGLAIALVVRARAGSGPQPEMQDHAMRDPRAPDEESPGMHAGGEGPLIDLGNELCPINGGAVDGETYTEWNGLRVGFCCPGCDGKFLKDPRGALEAAGIGWKDAAKAVEALRSGSPEDRERVRERWKVVRE